jgi:hypothetical protein
MIITRLIGGLGNQMFQYALGRALALRNRTELKLDLHLLLDRTPLPGMVFRDFDLSVFRIRAEAAPKEEIPFLYRMHMSGSLSIRLDHVRRRCVWNPGRERHFHFDSSVLRLRDGAYLEGYWQSPKYFEDIDHIIRDDFSFVTPMPAHVLELEKRIADSDSTCVHVRRTDFVGTLRHDTVGMDYFANAFRVIQGKVRRPEVFIFSDDIDWCKANLKFDCRVNYVGQEFAGVKCACYLWLMSHCRHFIIPNSTFGWWAAWMNVGPDKTVVAPKRWFTDEDINTSDLIPRTWIRV